MWKERIIKIIIKPRNEQKYPSRLDIREKCSVLVCTSVDQLYVFFLKYTCLSSLGLELGVHCMQLSSVVFLVQSLALKPAWPSACTFTCHPTGIWDSSSLHCCCLDVLGLFSMTYFCVHSFSQSEILQSSSVFNGLIILGHMHLLHVTLLELVLQHRNSFFCSFSIFGTWSPSLSWNTVYQLPKYCLAHSWYLLNVFKCKWLSKLK